MRENRDKELDHHNEIRDNQERLFFQLNLIKDASSAHKNKLKIKFKDDPHFNKIRNKFKKLRIILHFIIFLGIMLFFMFILIKINYIIILINCNLVLSH